MNKKTINTINEFLASGGVDSYVAHSGSLCFRTFAPFAWYALYCEKLGLTPKYNNGGYEATGDSATLSMDYVEGDVILSLGTPYSHDDIYSKCGEYIEIKKLKNSKEMKAFDVETTTKYNNPLMFGIWSGDWGNDSLTEVVGYAKI